jgi:hypothetical protein
VERTKGCSKHDPYRLSCSDCVDVLYEDALISCGCGDCVKAPVLLLGSQDEED